MINRLINEPINEPIKKEPAQIIELIEYIGSNKTGVYYILENIRQKLR